MTDINPQTLHLAERLAELDDDLEFVPANHPWARVKDLKSTIRNLMTLVAINAQAFKYADDDLIDAIAVLRRIKRMARRGASHESIRREAHQTLRAFDDVEEVE